MLLRDEYNEKIDTCLLSFDLLLRRQEPSLETNLDHSAQLPGQA